MIDDTVFALASGAGRAAIAVLRISVDRSVRKSAFAAARGGSGVTRP
jgi:tRNA U34 5-carboxymethylaminomethyl modifying GTPase MnmE/TrmE